MLKELFETVKPPAMQDLVAFWRATGTNLALAEPLVDSCVHSDYASSLGLQDDRWHLTVAHKLIENTLRPLEFDETTDLSNFKAQFVDGNTRWETLGIFLIAVLRATMDVPFFPSVYTTERRKQHLRVLLEQLIAFSLEICLGLDGLNDLQLIFQYEAVIAHSHMNGDLSKSSP